MDVDERARRELYTQLANTMGTKAADTLMSNLPPAGWADMATKHDLANVEERMNLRLASFEERMELRLQAVESRLEARMDRQFRDQTRVIVFSMVASMAAFAGIVVTAG